MKVLVFPTPPYLPMAAGQHVFSFPLPKRYVKKGTILYPMKLWVKKA